MKAIIFGCGQCGTWAYYKLKNYYDMIAWSDNRQSLWGTERKGIPVVEPGKIRDLQQNEDVKIFVCMEHTDDVVAQLRSKGIGHSCLWRKGFFYSADGMYPIELAMTPFVTTDCSDGLHVLFVSGTANIRDHKMAKMVKEAGNHVYLAYLVGEPHISSPGFADMYEEIFPIMSMKSFVNFIKESSFDVIHCSSEPDYLTPLLARLGKPVIHDCHDLRSSNREVTPDMMMVEYLAHKHADGVIYPSCGLRDEAIKKFKIPIEKTLVIENLVSKEIIPDRHMPKMSRSDEMIHCVYEGGVVAEDKSYKYYYCYYWLELAKAGVHIHFYTAAAPDVCHKLESLHDNIHYEGNLSSAELALEMSKYDVGLCFYNVTDENRHYLEMSSPNKLYEYINAGLPVAIGDITAHRKIVEANHWGKVLKWEEDIFSQIKEISDIEVSKKALQSQNLFFEDFEKQLLNFYGLCMGRNNR